jgi:DNA-binding NtrC family response regulator
MGIRTILLVEDEPVIRKFAAIVLRNAGHLVLPARSGEEAMAILRGSWVEIDLLITDIRMEGMNGLELAASLKTQMPRLRIILMSAFPGQYHTHKAVEGMDAVFLEKPFLPRTLEEIVLRALTPVHSPISHP